MRREILVSVHEVLRKDQKKSKKKASRNKRIKAKLPPRDSSDLIIHFTVLLG